MTAATRTRSRLPLVGLLLAATCACAQGDQGGPLEASRLADAPPAESLQTTLQHADTSFQDGDYSEARKAYEQVLQISPGHPRATANLATCYIKDRAVKKAQDLLLAYLAGHPDDPAALMVLARARMRQGEMGPAADALRQVLKSHPDFVMAHYNLGFIGYRSRHYDEAEKHLKRALELKPDLPDGHYTLGLTFLALGRYPEAIASLERAVAIEPRHVGARFNLANACARAGRMKEAEKHQAIYAEISGRSKSQKEKDAQVTTSSVKAIQFLLDKKYPEALEEYQRLAGSHPDYAPLYSQIGQLQIRLGKRDEAFASLRKAVELDPKLADPHYLLAGLYRERGDTQAADRELEIFAALEAIPEGKSGY